MTLPPEARKGLELAWLAVLEKKHPLPPGYKWEIVDPKEKRE